MVSAKKSAPTPPSLPGVRHPRRAGKLAAGVVAVVEPVMRYAGLPLELGEAPGDLAPVGRCPGGCAEDQVVCPPRRWHFAARRAADGGGCSVAQAYGQRHCVERPEPSSAAAFKMALTSSGSNGATGTLSTDIGSNRVATSSGSPTRYKRRWSNGYGSSGDQRRGRSAPTTPALTL